LGLVCDRTLDMRHFRRPFAFADRAKAGLQSTNLTVYACGKRSSGRIRTCRSSSLVEERIVLISPFSIGDCRCGPSASFALCEEFLPRFSNVVIYLERRNVDVINHTLMGVSKVKNFARCIIVDKISLQP